MPLAPSPVLRRYQLSHRTLGIAPSRRQTARAANLPVVRPSAPGSASAVASPLPGLATDPTPVTGLGRQVETIGARGGLTAVASTRDGKLVACGDFAGQLRIYDTKDDWRLVAFAYAHVGGVTSLDWNPAGTLLASVGNNGVVCLWTPDGTPAGRTTGATARTPSAGVPTANIWPWPACTVSPPKIWSDDFKTSVTLTGHKADARTIAWSPGRQAVGNRLEGQHGPAVERRRQAGVGAGRLGRRGPGCGLEQQGADRRPYDRSQEVRLWNADGKPAAAIDLSKLNVGRSQRHLDWSSDGTRLVIGATG